MAAGPSAVGAGRGLALVIYSNVGQATVFVMALIAGPTIRHAPGTAYIAALFSFAPAALILLLLIRHEWTAARALVALAVQSGILILVFAAFYHGGGITAHPPGNALADALYFSIVTWTTGTATWYRSRHCACSRRSRRCTVIFSWD